MFKIIIQRNPAKMHFEFPSLKDIFIKKLSVIFLVWSQERRRCYKMCQKFRFRTLLLDYT